MNFKEYFLLENASLPANKTYGFWLGPDGRVVPVDFEMHGEVAETILAEMQVFDYGDGAYYELYDRGWWRVMCSYVYNTVYLENSNEKYRSIKTMAGLPRTIKRSIEDIFLKYNLYGKQKISINNSREIDPLED